jgi:ATP-binding cassette subfamily F protein 3
VLVQFNGVSKAFGAQTVLQNVTFQIYPSEKIGLIGTNGSGKTTLLKILSSRLEPDNGEVSRKSGLQVGTLEQIPDFHESTTVFDEGLRAFANLIAVENEMRQLEHDISDTHRQDLMDRYASLQHEFELHGGYRFRAMTEAALRGVGFSKEGLGRAANTLSGGEKNRLALAKLLLSEADLLLLDEPTNHLDIRSIEWLERFLKETSKAVVVVSHDRIFLDRVASRTIEVYETRIYDYPGNYTEFLRLREERQARQEKEWRQQQEWIAEQEEYVRRNIAGQKTKQAQSRRNMLARVKRIEKPRGASTQVKFRFLPVDRSRRTVLATRNLRVGYDEPLIRDLNLHVERGSRWAILGGNGTGKTTLLKTLTGSLSPLSGELDWSEGTGLGYYDQQLAGLNLEATILDEIRSLDSTATDGELRSWMAQFLFSGEDIFKKVGSLSGGEKSRVALAKLIYESPTVLALDEPTNHLDIASREALESALVDYPGTILFVTHDRYLAQKIATHLVYLEDGTAHMFDRLSAFESWLDGRGEENVLDEPPKPEPAKTEARPKPAAPTMSKNRRDKLESEIASNESQIAALETELGALESSFSNPSPQIDWEGAHRRHAEIRQTLDSLYGRLEELSAQLLSG